MTKWKDLRVGDWVRHVDDPERDLTVKSVDRETGRVSAEKNGKGISDTATSFRLVSAVVYPGRRLPRAFSARVGKRLPRAFRGAP